MQGILEIIYQLEQYLKAISGMSKVSLQPSGGTQAIFANVETIQYTMKQGAREKREMRSLHDFFFIRKSGAA